MEIPKYSKWIKPTVKASTRTGNRKVYLNWNKIDGADGYKVYMFNKETQKYDLVKTVTDSNITSHVQTQLNASTIYAFRVRGFASKTDGTQINGKISTVAKAVTPPQQVTEITAASIVTGQSVVKWTKVPKAKGYKIYRSSSLNGSYIAVKTIANGSVDSFTDTKITSGITYYYKVRAFTVNPDGSRTFGKISKAKEVKVK